MTNKDVGLRSVLFLVVGILLLLSLIICIYIVNDEKDLVKISSTVIDVKKDSDGTGKNDVTVSYTVNSNNYEYNFYYKDYINVGDKIDIYYHDNDATDIEISKTTKLIFIFPIMGLVLCIIGLIELFKNSNNSGDRFREDYEVQALGISGDYNKVKVLADDEIPLSKLDETGDIPIKQIYISSMEKEKYIPRYYYISGGKLFYEVGNEVFNDISLESITKVTQTINSEGKLVKVTVESKSIILVLTEMKDTNLSEVTEYLHESMLSIDDEFQEEIEYKEY
jgi:hypothetical protein